MGETLISPNLGGSYVTTTAQGTNIGLDVNIISSSAGTLGSTWELGLSNFQIIHKAAGSPAVSYTFSNYANSFLIQNLGSAPVYYTFNATANPANSGTAFLQGNDGISFDFSVGSISIQSSGITSSDVQCIRLS